MSDDDEIPLSSLLGKKNLTNAISKRKKYKKSKKSNESAHTSAASSEEIMPVRSVKRPRIRSNEYSSPEEMIVSKNRKNILSIDDGEGKENMADIEVSDENDSTEDLVCSEYTGYGEDNDAAYGKETTKKILLSDGSDDDNDEDNIKTKMKSIRDDIKGNQKKTKEDTGVKDEVKNGKTKKLTRKYQLKSKDKEKSILDGTNWVNKFAAEKRRQAIRRGAFREERFEFMGETLIIWSLKDFFEKDMWKEDAIERVTKKRKKGKLEIGCKKKVGDVDRFHKLLNQRNSVGKMNAES